MGDLLQRGSDWLEGQRHAHLSRPVVYVRGDDEVALLATIGRTVFEQADESGIVMRTESRDYLVRAEDLVLDSMPVLPEAGDRIRESDGDPSRLYEVNAPGTEPPWRYSDPYRRTLRVHTKFIGEAP